MSGSRFATSGAGVVWALVALGAVLIVAGVAIPGEGPLGHFGLPALIGFLAAAAIGVLALVLGPLLSRPEDYYDR